MAAPGRSGRGRGQITCWRLSVRVLVAAAADDPTSLGPEVPARRVPLSTPCAEQSPEVRLLGAVCRRFSVRKVQLQALRTLLASSPASGRAAAAPGHGFGWQRHGRGASVGADPAQAGRAGVHLLGAVSGSGSCSEPGLGHRGPPVLPVPVGVLPETRQPGYLALRVHARQR